MDYEKAYKAALTTAKQWIKDGCEPSTKICLELLFPELRGLEDERIRKWLIDYFSSIKKTVWIHRDITCEQILDWLEKQKEHPKNAISIPADCATNAKCPYKIHGDEDFIGDIKDTPAYHFGFDEGVRSEREKQKEQKPAEWSEEDADILNCCISSIEEAKENRYAYKETDGDTSYDREIDWLKSLRPSWKPNEEQMGALQHAIDACESEWDYQDDELRSLLNDIKKL